MGLLIRLAIGTVVLFAGYNFASDKLATKIPEWKNRAYEITNPKGRRADLLEDLDKQIADLVEIYGDIESIDLESIEDPVLREKIRELKEKISLEKISEVQDIINDIKELNEEEGIVSKGLGKLLNKVLPDDPEPSPTHVFCVPPPEE